jgi:hypothetical protein
VGSVTIQAVRPDQAAHDFDALFRDHAGGVYRTPRPCLMPGPRSLDRAVEVPRSHEGYAVDVRELLAA